MYLTMIFADSNKTQACTYSGCQTLLQGLYYCVRLLDKH